MKILSILTASKDDKNQKAAERITRQLKRNQEKLIDDLDAKKDKLLAQKETLEAISVTTSDSKIDSWANDYHKVLVDIKLVEKEIEIAGETLTEMFTDAKARK